jgi:hypothetical protein
MFFWSFWYIICIFLILFQLDMNFLSINLFSGIPNTTQHFCYRGWTYPELLTSGDLDWVHCHANRRPSHTRFTPMLILARVTDWWGYCLVTSHIAVDLVNGWPTARPHRRRDRRRRWRRSMAPEDIRVGWFEPGQWFEPLTDSVPSEWLPEQLRRARLRRRAPAKTQLLATANEMTQQEATKSHRLTRMLKRCLARSMLDGDDGMTINSGGDCAKGTARFSPPQAPLLDSLHQNDDEDMGFSSTTPSTPGRLQSTANRSSSSEHFWQWRQ